MRNRTISERALVLAPQGRDAALASAMLAEARVAAEVCGSLRELVAELNRGAGLVVVTEEALATADLAGLSEWLGTQQEWSDLPFVLLTRRGGGLERNPAAARLLEVLGNVTFLERPFHPTTLISLAQAALRGRRRQYEARSRLEELRASEERYRTLFNSMDEGFCIIEFLDGPDGPGSDYVHVDANPAYERHAGIEGVVGQKVRTMVPAEAAGWVETYGEVLRTGRAIRFERELEATGRYLELAAFRIEPAHRRQVAVLFQDITRRKEAEIALRTINETLERRVAAALAERKLLADLVESADALVHVVDREMTWLAVNRAAADEFERLHAARPRVGENMLVALAAHPAEQARQAALWRRALAGETFSEIVETEGEDGARYHEMKFDVLRGPDGTPTGAYRFVYDVTARVRDQARLEEATVQMHEMAKLETLGQLTGGVAHDFNNLLTPITGALDLLSRRPDNDARAARLIDGALQSADRAKTLVQRLLGFARRQALEARPTDLAVLLEGMHDLIASSVGSGVEVRVAAAEGLPAALADPNQLELAILNLCVNARDAMAGSGTLAITLDAVTVARGAVAKLARGRYLRLAVQDDGAGMDEATLARAIEPFFSTKEVGRGTGLGLSMVHGLAAQLGGGFVLSSEAGRGTRAELYLPQAPSGDAVRPVDGEACALPAARPLTVLLVDDEDLVREGAAEMLRDLGHSVIEAASGAEALARLASGIAADVVVTDYTMPRMDGGELARRVRERDAGLPVLLVTGYAAGDLPVDLPRLAKPFRRDDLADALARLIDSPR